MGNRLTKITTRTGDQGTTGLGDGTRVAKDALRIQALGDVDELNSQLGVLLGEPDAALPDSIRVQLLAIQHDLFDLGAELCIPGHTAITPPQVAQLDQWISAHNRELPVLKEFILPGGSRAAGLAHVARAVCRRAERSVVTLGHDEPVSEAVRQYLNRLSDLLFILARRINQHLRLPDVLWQREK